MRLCAAVVLALVVLLLRAATASAAVVTISGTAMFDESGHAWAECNGITPNVSLSVNGGAVQTVPCAPGTGAFSFSANLLLTDVPIAVWLNPAVPGSKGILYTRNLDTTSNIVGLTPTANRVWIRSESGTPVDNSDIITDVGTDADIPVGNAAGRLFIPSDVELHVASGATFDEIDDLEVGSIHVANGGTFNASSWHYINLTASGVGQTCSNGAGVARPLCVDAGGTFVSNLGYMTFDPDDGGTVEVEARNYGFLLLTGNASNTSGRIPHFILGTATGQTISGSTLASGGWCGAGCPEDVYIDSGPYHPDVSFDGIGIGTSGWHGTGAFTINVTEWFEGDGDVDLPGATVNVSASHPTANIGPDGGQDDTHDWQFWKLNINNGTYTRSAFGSGGGRTTPWNSGGAQLDTVAGVVSDPWSDAVHMVAGTSNNNGFVMQFWDQNGLAKPAPCAAQTTVWNEATGGDVARGAGMGTPPSGYLVWGDSARNGGDGIVLLADATTCTYTQPFGTIDGTDAGAVKDAINFDYDGAAGGYDSARFATTVGGGSTDNISVAGTVTNGAGNRDFGVVEYDSTGTPTGRKVIWDSGGGNDNVAGGCYDDGYHLLYVVGTIPSNGNDIAVRALDLDTYTWSDNFGNTDTDASSSPDTYIFNSSAARSDTAAACSQVENYGDDIIVTGTSSNGANTDIVAFRLGAGGEQRSPWGTLDSADAGTTTDYMSWNSGANDVASSLVETGAGEVLIGQSGANGGDEALVKIDPDGAIDTTWWMGGGDGDGVWTFNSGGVQPDTAGGVGTFENDTLYIGVQDGGATGGDIAIRAFDTAGAVRSSSGAGDTRIIANNEEYNEPGLQWTHSWIHLGKDLNVGQGSGATTYLDLESNDLGIDAENFVNLKPTGWVRASSDIPIRSNNDFGGSGGFTANQGRVEVGGQQFRAVIQLPAASGVHDSFYDLVLTYPNSTNAGQKLVDFDNGNTLRITHGLTIQGASCNSKLPIGGNGGQATINTTGATVTLDYVDFSNVTFAPAVTATHSDKTGATVGVTTSTTCGTSPVVAPNGMYTDDTDTSSAIVHNSQIAGLTPHFSWFNRQTNATKEQTKVWSDVVTGDVLSLFHVDGVWTDSGSLGTPIVPASAPNDPSFTTGAFGQAIDCDGDDRANVASNAAFDSRTFTADAWVKTTNPTAGPNFYGGLFERSNGGTDQFTLEFENNGSDFKAGVSVNAATDYYEVYDPDPAALKDGQWHYVAVTQQQTGAQWVLRMYVDGVLVDQTATSGTPDVASGMPLDLCYGDPGEEANAQIDEPRFSRVAWGTDDIMGYYRTHRPHADLIWDSSPGNTGNAFSGNPTLNAGQRTPDVVYGGAAGSLLLDGARYWVQMRTRNNGGTWSNWNEGDWFQTITSQSLTLTSPTTVGLGTPLPGTDAVGTSTLQVSTTGVRGYTISASAPSDTWGLDSARFQVPWWTGTPTTPTTWAAGTSGANGYVGMTLLSATGAGKDTSRWGTGSTPTDFANLKYTGLRRTSATTVHSTSSYSAATDTVVVGWRLDPGSSTLPGYYATTYTFTATANP